MWCWGLLCYRSELYQLSGTPSSFFFLFLFIHSFRKVLLGFGSIEKKQGNDFLCICSSDLPLGFQLTWFLWSCGNTGLGHPSQTPATADPGHRPRHGPLQQLGPQCQESPWPQWQYRLPRSVSSWWQWGPWTPTWSQESGQTLGIHTALGNNRSHRRGRCRVEQIDLWCSSLPSPKSSTVVTSLREWCSVGMSSSLPHWASELNI